MPVIRLLTLVLLSATAVLRVEPQVAGPADRVDVLLSLTRGDANCETFDPGDPVEAVKPEYPPEAASARIGGAVRVSVLVSKKGRVEEILSTEGPAVLRSAALLAISRTRFERSLCGGKSVEAIANAVYTFEPVPLRDVYIDREKVEEFGDVGRESPFYEPLVSLTDNYRIAFGYADGKFHPDEPLTKADLCHFLRKTLDLLQTRAELANKIPREIDLYYPLNTSGIRSADEIADFDETKPYADSVGFLVSKYDIVLTDSEARLNPLQPVRVNQLIGYWESVFGTDAVPVNFSRVPDEAAVMSRGEFALFLHESLYVLTYKVLP